MKNFTINLKKIRNVFLAILLVGISVKGYTQADGINYQAAIRDGSDNLVKNQSIDLKFTISEGATAVFTEEHKSITTSAQGLVNVVIGKGTALTGTFNDVDWLSNKQENLEVEVDLGSGYVSVGKQDFQAVPYALNVPWEKSNNGELKYRDQSSATERIEINADNGLIFNQDLLSLGIPTTSSDGSQFIEFEKGSSVVARINGDGSAEFKNIEVDTLGASNKPVKGIMYNESMPMAWGYISSSNSGTAISQFGIKSVSYNSTTNDYTITLENSWIGKPAVIVTPITQSGSGEIGGTNIMPSNSNSFKVYFRKGTNSTTETTDFMVVVYGRTK